ncbi:P-loop containing nucleoside triphosphate hydrolase protein [Fusarium flagelliforme]|uniref:P-loop containing nucleoside triphosphate hydrolase protein n=1 Tax=Fusarium flagelliforme TaxID=2675880 RepID=UPI001E8E0609|nr:P-loop containing nucleoside triphosphate hydrolase protein [Fusarium flagelliforme]KAH7184636.1 P-loop containing nucleoside triphosphate hydrolase protein [Fusarium flagelliforme]
MGATISQLWTPPPIAVGVVSIPSAGKTSIIRKLSGGQDPIPPLNETVNNTIFTVKSQEYNVLDYTSDRRIRGVWRKLLFRMRAIIFVVDSTDKENMDDARDALWEVLYEEQLEPRPILILANKQDDPKAMTVSELVKYLKIEKDLAKTRKCRIMPSSAFDDKSLEECLEWLREIVRTNPY